MRMEIPDRSRPLVVTSSEAVTSAGVPSTPYDFRDKRH
ncbi:hypothetical protein STXM2123_3026 [Streptomyces sp. F-3]|nr:hypothetical protein STXM2123_3026 [Streptomyces sp. F-3]